MPANPSGSRSAPARVSLARCPDYDPGRVVEAVEAVLSELEPLPLPAGERILLKPNCLSSNHDPEAEVNTRAEVVEAVGRYLKARHDARLVIADSAGLGSYGRSRKAYRRMGLPAVAERLEAELADIDGEGLGLIELASPSGLVLDRFQATDLLLRVDAVVNIPKLKTHLLTGLTGAVKNCLGLLPGGLKREVHVTAPAGPLLSRALVDIYAAVKPALHVMDAVIGMEGAGPAQGKPKRLGWLMASADGVALDFTAATMMGLKPERVASIAAAAAAGLGAGRRSEIELVGADWAELPATGFRRAFSGLQTWLAWFMPRTASGKIVDWFTEAKPRPRHEKCDQCGECVAACPVDALSFVDERLSVTRSKCIECYCCLEHCPSGGLWAPRNLMQKLRGRP